jgi:predicted lipoprotein with Yx(FWY)xxD motif
VQPRQSVTAPVTFAPTTAEETTTMHHPAATATALAIAAALTLGGCARPGAHTAAPRLAPVARASGPEAGGPTVTPLTVQVQHTETVGRVLADPSGHTLYYDAQDTATRLDCVGPCTSDHHPLLHQSPEALRLPEGLTGTLTLITRPDGQRQVAYDNSPLYTYVGDHQPGEVSGAVPHWRPMQPQNEEPVDPQ